jgi:alpha-L-fucosidase 2
MNKKNVISLMTPASWHGDMWREGLPSGNGTIGAMVFGNIADETIMINHSELRHWGKKSVLPDISEALKKARALIDEGNYQEANWVSANMLKDKGYEGKLFTPCPLCDIKLHTDTDISFTDYYRSLDMETGEILVSWNERENNFKRRTFVSRTDSILATKLEGTKDISTKIFVQLHETFGADTKRMKEECKDTLEVFIEDNFIYYSATNDDGTDFGAVVRVISEGEVTIEEAVKLCISNSTEITIFADFFVKEDRKKAFSRIREKLSRMNNSYDSYLATHVKEHKEIFNSCDMSITEEYSDKFNEEILLEVYRNDVSNELLEKLWRFGRYLLISGTKELPFPLYGIWGGTYNLMWSHNMANENLEMIYWHALTGGLEYSLIPVINYYTDLLEDYKLNAKNLFGLSGIYVPAGSSPGMGLPNQIVPVIMNWIGAAGWLSQHFYNYYLYTGDELLLKEKILPFMENALTFYEEYLVMDSNGYYKIYPSVSPENSPKNFFTEPIHERMPHICPSVINATMDFAIIKELLINMLEVSEKYDLYKEKKEKWKELLSHIPPYEKNEDGAIKEWMHKDLQDRYNHRHISHIYPVFPGTEYIYGRDDEDILAAFELAVNKRVLGSQTGWSFSHMASIYARFEKAEKAMDCLRNLAKSCLLKNLMTLHNDWRRMGLTMNLGEGHKAPMQLDANMGIVNALQEMLLYVSKDLVKVLPACPNKFSKGSVKGFRFCTGEIDFSWDKELGKFSSELKAKRETNITLLLPEICEEYELLYVESGEKNLIQKRSAFTVNLPKGCSLIIKNKD